MKKWNLLMALIAGLSVSSFAQSESDVAAIKAIVKHIEKNWNDHHFDEMRDYATEDCQWVNVVGMWWQGRANVIKAHQAIFDTMFKGTKLQNKEVVVKFLTDDVALANVLCSVGAYYSSSGQKFGDGDDLLTFVFVKKNNKWLLRAAHNTPVDARAAKSNPIK